MTVDQQVTVLIPTSPVHSHPDTSVIEETIGSVRERLPHAEILLMCDGPHPALDSDRVAAYHEYLQRAAWKAQHEWGPCLPVLFDEHRHQHGMVLHALGLVRTPLVLWVEHDCPLIGEVPWEPMADVIASGGVAMIRLHHEANILEPHRHLMLGDGPQDYAGVPLWPTIQWSSRPHLASAGWYRTVMGGPWWEEHDGMTEDRLHSVLQAAYAEHGQAGWDQFRLAVYHPDGDIKRSTHLDGRGPDEKVVLRGG